MSGEANVPVPEYFGRRQSRLPGPRSMKRLGPGFGFSSLPFLTLALSYHAGHFLHRYQKVLSCCLAERCYDIVFVIGSYQVLVIVMGFLFSAVWASSNRARINVEQPEFLSNRPSHSESSGKNLLGRATDERRNQENLPSCKSLSL